METPPSIGQLNCAIFGVNPISTLTEPRKLSLNVEGGAEDNIYSLPTLAEKHNQL